MKVELSRLLKSFHFAYEGIIHAYKTEKNIRVHTIIGIFVILLASYLKVEKWEWMIIIILIGAMLSLELLNSAIERVVDLVTDEYEVLAKQAKDLSAGAVFVFAIISVMIGLIIFGSRLMVNILNFLTI
jgi:undecaprenol kinase